MEDLINQVTEKAGIPKDKAKKAVEVVLDYLKNKLPAPIAGQIDGVLGGGGAANALGGLFGKK